MKLSPLDLRKQQFRKVLRGYDADEVRAYLNEVARQWEEVLDDTHNHDARVRELEHKLKHYERVELALQEALESARETGRRAESNAEQKAKLIVEEAELRALRIMQDAEQERYALRQDLVKLTHRQNEVAARLRAFLMSELEVLAQFQGDDPIGFIKLVPAGAQEEAAANALPPAAQRQLEASPEPVAPAAPVTSASVTSAPMTAAATAAPMAAVTEALPVEDEEPSRAEAGADLGMMAEAFAEPAVEEPRRETLEPAEAPAEWAPETDEPSSAEAAYEEVEPEPEPMPIERAPIERAPFERAPIERAPIEPASVTSAAEAPAPIERAPIERVGPAPGPVAETPAPEPAASDAAPAADFDFEAWFNSETDESFPSMPSAPPAAESGGLPVPGPGHQPEDAPAVPGAVPRPLQDVLADARRQDAADATTSGNSVWDRYRQADVAADAPATPATAAAALADSPFFRPAAPPPEPGPAPGSDAAQGWSLRSIVTGEAEPPTATEDEREKIRRLLEGLD